MIAVLYEVNVMFLTVVWLAADAWLKLFVLCRDAVWMLQWLQWLITLMDQKDILTIILYAFPLFTLFLGWEGFIIVLVLLKAFLICNIDAWFQEDVTPEKVIEIVEKLRKGEKPPVRIFAIIYFIFVKV